MKKIIAIACAAVLASACNPQETAPPAATAPPADSAAASAPQVEAPTSYAITNMSPRSTPAGTPFNVQVDQGSGISFEVNRPVPPGDIQVMFDGKPLGGVATNGVIITATIPASYLETAGTYPVTVQLPGAATAVPAGDFVVE